MFKKLPLNLLIFAALLFSKETIVAQETDTKIYDIISKISADSIEADIRKLVSFGTRNTFSDTVSDKRGIGAARRWIKSEFDNIASQCGCMDVFYQKDFVTKEDGSRIPKDAWVVNVVAIQKGTKYPNRYIIMSGDIDSRASNTMNFKIDAPGANDNASGMAGTMEAARVLSQYEFESSIVYVGLSGEEQGLFGGKGLAEYAKKNNWDIIGILNNDMIGNIEGVDGVISNRDFRIFSEPVPPTETENERNMRRFYGGEVDGISRQLARYIHKTTEIYMPEMNPMMIYRLDRFGRGGHHRPFNDLGFAGVRIMEAHENYNRQHQDIRTENGIEYGDVIEGVNFDYAKKLTTVNAINLASLAWAPPAPAKVEIGGIVEADTKLRWEAVKDAAGYKIYWRDTTAPQWQHSRFVKEVTEFTLDGIVIDNFFFGVSTVGKNGHESVVVFPSGTFR
ncbi:fibronectin type III repeat-containing secreted peptidase, family M28 [Zunongwangia profunda SM-A87]|uniref:Fibronectin type III repeat-containing secreted peptidase, family M28 n=1 Tax=Zunongwangia profunda (strain DSM 18752 / CCTCC AB 206139 / SM-A87) TaxID=655815 RepID=D5BD99_ZUNPS|nr:M28 family metallopeptidase [Zunongwangia profunda]ADF52779.1 fibronectin type III repeat-containing secreted peptidase, family M28 [Zunongwangia profunda SM-A87]|tara:strand:- start:276 stop:1625 length:1350 start_codon:yes stop_codon:yes gene_type:complete